jgi:hypothetical protein
MTRLRGTRHFFAPGVIEYPTRPRWWTRLLRAIWRK